MNLSNKEKQVWKKGINCNCQLEGCKSSHKKCSICKGKILYGAHESVQPTSAHRWNIDHIKPTSKNGSNEINNLQITCVDCNREKGNRFK